MEHRSGTGAPSLRSVVPTAGERPLALPVKRLYIALNAPVMRLVTTPLELKDLIGQIADAHDAHCRFSNVRPIRPNKRSFLRTGLADWSIPILLVLVRTMARSMPWMGRPSQCRYLYTAIYYV